MPAIATGEKIVLFGDFKYYWIADRKGILRGKMQMEDENKLVLDGPLGMS